MKSINLLLLLLAASSFGLVDGSKALATDNNFGNGTATGETKDAAQNEFKEIAQLRGYINNDPAVILDGLQGWHTVHEVEMLSLIDSKTAKVGDLVEGKLPEDLRCGVRLIAGKNSLVRGHIVEIGSPRRFAAAIVSKDRHMNSRAFVAIQFDEIIDETGCRLPIQGTPCRQSNERPSGDSTARALKVDGQGRIVQSEAVLTGGMKTASLTAKIATNVPVAGSVVVGTLAGPVAMSAIGAANPSIAYNAPVSTDDEHTRLQAATYGFVTNLPGVPFILKGNEIVVAPGDQVMINIWFVETGYKLPPVNLLSNATLHQ